MSQIQTVNPATGHVLATYDRHERTEVDRFLRETADAFPDWRDRGFEERAQVLNRAADLLEERVDDLAALMTSEMGKPVTSSRAEVQKCAWVCRYYAEHGESFLAPETIETDASHSGIVYRPLGPVLAIMPWNFPLWQVFRFAAPALMAGNTGLLKHASQTTGCALAIEKIWSEAGCPDGVFRTLLIGHDEVARLIEGPVVKAVTLTGSTQAGREVAAAAGRALKKSVMELGGSDPYVVLEDADPDKAADICVKGRMINNGQSCIAAKRFITTPGIHEDFVRAVISRMGEYVMGDPMKEDTKLGPMASTKLRDELHKQVGTSLEAGANRALGGMIPDREGAYYPATVLTEVTPSMPAGREELFGPVACVLAARDEAHAFELANGTAFGLGAAVITSHAERGRQLAEDALDAGCCFVNDHVKSDPRLPFGGIKQSGYGRELSRQGIREFVNCKTVYVA